MIKNSTSIAILMATYNGEQFIREQLDSLFAQTYTDWTLFVRDDGSTDNTISIIESYQKEHHNIVIIDNEGKNLGPFMNFMELLQKVDSPLYMFIDQDDVWLPHKIENEVAAFRSLNCDETTPGLVFTNLQLVDENLNVLSASFWNSIHFSPYIFNSFTEQAFIGYITGCTMLFNKKAKEISFPVAQYAPMHDWWVAICIYKANGKVGFVETPQMLYRKHGNNVTGNFVSSQKGKSLCVRFKEMATQYQLMKNCGAVSSFFNYIYLKNKIKNARKNI